MLRIRPAVPRRTHMMGDKMIQVVHIGQRKTGTSWLQRTLKCAHDDGVEFHNGKKALKAWGFKHKPKRTTDAGFAELTAILAKGRGKHAIFSWENMVLYPHDQIANAVQQALPNAHILMTTRAPDSYTKSQYRHNVQHGNYVTPQAYAENLAKDHLQRSHDVVSVKAAFEAFGFGGRLTFMPYEALKHDAVTFLSDISALFGLDLEPYRLELPLNQSPPPYALELMRRINKALDEQAPDVLNSADFKLYRRMTMMALPRAVDLEGVFEGYVEKHGLEYTLPSLPVEFVDDFKVKMLPLRDLPAYQPYLAEYGLAD